MEIHVADRVRSIGTYAFAEVDRKVAELREQGIEPTDFGVGDPADPTPGLIREALAAGAERHKSAGYPSYVGSLAYREAVAAWVDQRFGVSLDPATEITSTIGSKEGIFNFHEGFVDPGDVVIVPNPGYPPYTRGTLFAEGEIYRYPVVSELDFLPDLQAIPPEIRKRARLLWINYPNSPTGRVAPDSFFEEVVAFGREHEIIVCSDEAYSELYFTDEPPRSILEFAREGVVQFQSLSKRSAMTGYRIGWVAGDSRIIDTFKKVKTNIDSGTPNFVQEAAIAALGDETHVERFREAYRKKEAILAGALADLGLPECRSEGTIYLWQEVPDGMTSVEFAQRLLAPEVAIVCTPGAWISAADEAGNSPGDGYVRFALVPSIEATERAAARLENLELT